MAAIPDLNRWASGTLTALERQSLGIGQGLTPAQVITDLRRDNDRLREQLADARHQLAGLERQLDALKATAGQDRLVTQVEAARLLRVNPSTISRWLAAGHFRTYTGAGKKPLLYESSLHRPSKKKRGRQAP